MRFSSFILAAAAVVSTVHAQKAQQGYKGFNYGAFFNNQAPKKRADFEYEFNAAKQLPGTGGGFTSARLYTMVQWGTSNTIIEAIQAAINTKTTLLLGMWASSGQATFNNELTALKNAISQYGSAFTDLVVGISVGSEDLYRITPTSIKNGGGPGAQPAELLNYIRQTREAIKGTRLQGKPVGHVDTWTAFVNASNNAVIAELDFLGMDAYPYFQTTMANDISKGKALFFDALDQTIKASQGKDVWVTETGWPVSGKKQNQAEASTDNAKRFWKDVSCDLMARKVNFYYYMLQEAQYGNPDPDFGIKGPGDLMQVPARFDLTCPATANPVSKLFSCLLLSVLSPLFLLLLYNVSIISLVGSRLLPAKKLCCPCTCDPPRMPVVHSPLWSRGPVDGHAKANGYAKSLAENLSSSVRSPTSVLSITSIPITGASTAPVPTATPIPSLAPPTVPPTFTTPFELPRLIVPIDKANPATIIGPQFVARLSSTHSSLFNFDIRPEFAGKMCNLVFHLPPDTREWWQPFQLNAPGGINVSRLETPATPNTTTSTVGASRPVGSVGKLVSGQGHLVTSAPCEAGKKVGYQVDAANGLDLQYFQMVTPPSGLFITVSDNP